MDITCQREKERERERGMNKNTAVQKTAKGHNIIATHLVLTIDTVATLDNVLFDMPQVDGGRQFPPLPTGLRSAPHPHR